ncbi:707_t:CDS:2 [Diversispora eburnea]|uniref:707_t:CDS:1 n=1 Tax=Diversispora eburnea TaxID=1213867 RepID=A0A9N8VN94_9GLOM|nr:707_t:CDS:2 [Diversispora eburnea]
MEEIHVAAIDHTFLTWYLSTIGHRNICDKDINHIFRLSRAIDTFISHTIKEPSKKIKQMSKRKERKINSKTVRNMMSWAHDRFRNRLISKAEELNKIIITSVSEAYSNKLVLI